MQYEKKIFFFFAFIWFIYFSLERAQAQVQTSVGALFSQKRVHRGALIVDAPVIAPLLIFDIGGFLRLGRGGGVQAYQVFRQNHEIGLGVGYFDNNVPGGMLRLKDVEKDHKNKRRATWETSLNYQFKLQNWITWQMAYHKDMKAHKGNYYYAELGTSLIPLVTLGIGQGFGDLAHNRYLYGPEGWKGTTHTEAKIGLMLPFLPRNGVLRLGLTHFIINNQANYNADYIRGKRRNTNLSAFASWRL